MKKEIFLLRYLGPVAAVMLFFQTAFAADSGPVSLISESDIRATVDKLVSFGTRHVFSPKAAEAAEYLKESLNDLGIPASFDTFTASDHEMMNVVGSIPTNSESQPERWILLGAHYDSYAGPPDAAAPGADDNASGVAAVLAAAHALAQKKLRTQIIIVFFTGEEERELGSNHYVKEIMKDEKRKGAALIVDYIGTDMGLPDGTLIMYNQPSAGLTKTIQNAAAERVPDLHVWPMRSDMLPNFGDYKPFWKKKIPAVMFVREFNASSKQKELFHTENDLPDKLNYSQIVKVSKLIYYTVIALDAAE